MDTLEQGLLRRCRTILGNMAMESDNFLAGVITSRWEMSHEPLRNDAKNLLPLIDQALASTQDTTTPEQLRTFVRKLNDLTVSSPAHSLISKIMAVTSEHILAVARVHEANQEIEVRKKMMSIKPASPEKFARAQ